MTFFEDYVKKYDLTDKDIMYKYKHTLRVQSLCKLIAKEIGLTERQIEIASLCGLYHDIGRFEQDKRYNSFKDTKKYDHGDVGSEIFLNEFALKYDLSEEEKNIIFKSILYHNKFTIKDCSEKEKLYCQITRDADKLDILYVFANNILSLGNSSGNISDKCHTDFMNHDSIKREDVKSNRDEILLKLAFIWDINFDVSIKIIKDNKYYDSIEKILNDEKYIVYFKEIREFLKEN